jgi:predicted metal-dependent phosphotriesterase family hydrolase
MIRRLGPEHCFVSSDSGLVGTPNHADALVIAIRTLRAAGFDDAALDLLFRTNPRRLLGLQS